MRWLPLVLIACTPAAPERFVVVDGEAGDYQLTEATIPELEDPYRMSGALGDGSVGGYLDIVDGAVSYRGGGTLAVDYAVRDGVGVPLDADGLALWSFYHTLSAARSELEAQGYDTSELFPIDFAFQPSAAGTALITSNAAYVAGGGHLFTLLADPPNATLPLAANPVVIRHELGHALFQQIVVGDLETFDQSASGDLRMSALNEGFADMVASLLLDDPDILGASLPDAAGARLLTAPHSTAVALPLDEDFYSRGTVYASFTWDLRQGDDRATLLNDVFATLRDFGERRLWEQDDRVSTVDRFSALLLERVLTRRGDEADALCAVFEQRFPGAPEPASCSSR